MTIKIEFEVDAKDAALYLALYEALNNGPEEFSPHLEDNMGWLIDELLGSIVSKIDYLLEHHELESVDELGGMIPQIYTLYEKDKPNRLDLMRRNINE